MSAIVGQVAAAVGAVKMMAGLKDGDLSLPGEAEMDGRGPVPGAPFDEYEYEQLRIRTGHA
jgi:hypothetical protein